MGSLAEMVGYIVIAAWLYSLAGIADFSIHFALH